MYNKKTTNQNYCTKTRTNALIYTLANEQLGTKLGLIQSK